MEKRIVIVVVLTALLGGFQQVFAQNVRSRELFDFDWRFTNKPVTGANEVGFDDSAWTDIQCFR
jgi:hypothetical protein